jgi:hypothetical protein
MELLGSPEAPLSQPRTPRCQSSSPFPDRLYLIQTQSFRKPESPRCYVSQFSLRSLRVPEQVRMASSPIQPVTRYEKYLQLIYYQ